MKDCGRRTRALSWLGFVAFSMVVIAGDALLAQAPALAKPEPQPIDPNPGTVRILVSGRLLGYFRVPDQQPDDLKDCQAASNPAATAFNKMLDDNRGGAGTTLVVGMGENFSPELHSRLMSTSQTSAGESRWVPKDRFSWDWKAKQWVRLDRSIKSLTQTVELELAKGKGYITTDNVACFLSGAGFDALVPGKHDFYFGPERVRLLARLLATPELGYPAPSPPGHAVQMLAANLVIRTSFRDARPPVPDASKHLSFVTHVDGLQPASIKDGDTILPYVRKFQFSAKDCISPDLRASLRSNSHGKPDNLPPEPSVALLIPPAAADCRSGPVTVEVSLPRPEVLKAGLNYGICFTGKNIASMEKPYCVRFATDFPFFQYPNPVPRDAHDEQKYNDPAPFFVKTRGDTVVAAVFGVVDPKLREHVGELNAMWWNDVDGKKYKTEIALVDPVRALKQALEYFKHWYTERECGQLDGGDYEKCAATKGTFTGVKVLMAQMRSSEVRELAAHMENQFDLFISEAELERATPNQMIVFDKPAPALAQARQSFLLVPRPAYGSASSSMSTSVQVRSVEVTGLTDDRTQYVIKGTPQPVATFIQLCEQSAFKDAVAKAWAVLAPRASKPAPGCEEAFRQVTLAALRRQVHADVALLQTRDFFFGVPKDDTGAVLNADTINRVLWKGDFQMKLMVTGATLKSVLTRGAAFEAQDAESLSLEVEKGRGLVVLGAQLDPERKEYLINGAPLDEARVYTIATSDYIALGDTGYPDLAKPVVGRSPLPQDLQTLYPISDVLMNALHANIDPSGVSIGFDARKYLDHSNDSPRDSSTGLSPFERLKEWFSLDRNGGTFGLMSAPEWLVQNRRVKYVSLQKALISLSDVHNSLPEADRANLFAGVSVDQVNAKANTALNVAAQGRFGAAGQHAEWFTSGEIAYAKTSTVRATLSRLENYLSDRLILEPGLLWKVKGKQYPHVGPQVSMRVDTQIWPPWENFNLTPVPGGPTKGFHHDRSTSWLPRLGFRGENRKSSLGIGYEAAFVPRADEYDFKGSLPTLQCKVDRDDAKKVANCVLGDADRVSAATELSLQQALVFRHAAYADAKIVLGPDRFLFTTQWSAEYIQHRPDDNSTMTHLRSQVSAALTMKIFQNLSAQPEINVFWFRNQRNPIGFRQRKFVFGLNYTFDWFSGNDLKAIRHGKAAAASAQ